MAHPDFRRWYERLVKIGGCENPVYLVGRTVTSDPVTGEVLHVFTSEGQPFNRLMLPCGNRRSSRCVFCSWWYQGDTFHLVLAGLVGGKGVPESVREHPRVFMTLTAPSFGPVHTRVEKDGKVLPCRARRGGELCPHGVDISCPLGMARMIRRWAAALCADCFDYAGAVLFNAHAGRLWHRFTDDVRRVTLPQASALTAKEFAASVRVSFVKVAEYQRRGLVHFHAAVRLDGASGPESAPAAWATEEMLIEALGSSASRVRVEYPDEFGEVRELVFGEQFDARPIRGGDDGALSDDQVAGYVAKYSTKAAECVGTLDRPITCRDCKGSGLFGACPRCGGSGMRLPLEALAVPEHARRLIAAAWRLGALPQYEGLRLRAWAHQCGYGGHFCTKSRVYSVTRGALVDARAQYAAKQAGGGQRAPLPADAVVTRDWEYAGSGYQSLVEAQFAAQVRGLTAQNRELARDALADDPAYQDAKRQRARRGRDAA